jgi:TPR repeat protein
MISNASDASTLNDSKRPISTLQSTATLQAKSLGHLLFDEYFYGSKSIDIKEFMKAQQLVFHGHKCDPETIELLYFEDGELTPEIANRTIFGKRSSLKDVRDSLVHIFEACKVDTAEDCIRLGYGFYHGDLFLDHSRGFKWFAKSMRLRETGEGHFCLGVLYLRGEGVIKDQKIAFQHFKKGARMNHCTSSLYLSRCYRFGLGTDVNLQKSLNYLENAVEIPDAQYDLGDAYYHGHYGTQDFELSCEWYERAAVNGHVKAQHDLAYCYRHGLGRQQDFQKSLLWYETAANNGHAPSQNNLAFLYQHGLGDQVRMELAFYWFQQAAFSGYEPAVFNVGYMYLHGYGCKQDVQSAVQCFKRSEEYGPSQHQLGLCFASGLGVPLDPQKAFSWFIKAAHERVPAACNDVALLYELGIGVEQDIKLAVKWYRIAIELGDPSAQENMMSLFEKYPQYQYKNVPDYLWPVPIEKDALLNSIATTICL